MQNSRNHEDFELIVDKLVTLFGKQVETVWNRLTEARRDDLWRIDENFRSIKESINELMANQNQGRQSNHQYYSNHRGSVDDIQK